MPGKIRMGIISLTSCGGEIVVFSEAMNKHLLEWRERIDFVYAPFLRTSPPLERIGRVNVFLVEGAVSNDEDKRKVEVIREISDRVIAFGSCACTGMPSAQRNTFDEETLERIKTFLQQHNLWERVEPITKFIKVDRMIMGCPVREEDVVSLMDELIRGDDESDED